MLGDAYKAALRYGMTKREYMHSTPHDVDLFLQVKSDDEKQKGEIMNYTAWLNGLYVARAVASVMSKKSKYPKKPISDKDSEFVDSIVVTEDMSEEAKEQTRQLFLGNLLEMQNDFNRTHKTQNETGDG